MSLFGLFLIWKCNTQKNQIETPELTSDFHIELNEKYADPEKSPLSEGDLKDFKSLKFFPYNGQYKVRASFELTPNSIPFEMKTSTDRLPLYRKYAVLQFVVAGTKESLEAYQNQEYLDHPEYGKQLFIPYEDETNGIESYGGGRYIDIDIPAEGTDSIWLDFNRSYNPYCAYNYKYSCPKPPEANYLNVRIEAGVKAGIFIK